MTTIVVFENAASAFPVSNLRRNVCSSEVPYDENSQGCAIP